MKDENAHKIADRYHSFSDEELLSLAAQREQLTDEARYSLDEELRQRNLGLSATIKERDEETIEAPRDAEPPESELTELPADFFEDDEPLEAWSGSTRPSGITLIAFGSWLNAFLIAWVAIVFLQGHSYSAAIPCIFVALVFSLLGGGLFGMRLWSLRLAILWYSVNAVLSGLMIIVGGIVVLRGGEAYRLGSVGFFFSLVWSGLFVRYLLSPSVQRSEAWRQ
jgi:hypothetical protein